MDHSGPGIDDDAAAAADDAGWQRADVRESMLLMATMRPESDVGGGFPLRVRNLSAGGLMAECDRRLAKDERVAIDLRNVGEVAGVIAWVGGGKLGVRFDRPIDPKATRKPVATQAVAPRMLVGMDGRRPGLR